MVTVWCARTLAIVTVTAREMISKESGISVPGGYPGISRKWAAPGKEVRKGNGYAVPRILGLAYRRGCERTKK